MRFIVLLLTAFISLQSFSEEKFPDGTPIPDWFRQNEVVNIQTLGKKYNIVDYGVTNDSTLLQTEKIQSVIDQASQQGGGVIVIPKGPQRLSFLQTEDPSVSGRRCRFKRKR